jgi:hypothetical protein
MRALRKLLGAVPGLSYELESSCCGMAGSFGLEAEHYQASQAMAGLSLLPALAAAPMDATVIANDFPAATRLRMAAAGGRGMSRRYCARHEMYDPARLGPNKEMP